MIAWFTKNDVAANILLAFIVCAGLISLSYKIPLEVFPSLETDRIRINISLRGATPEDAELAIATRVEEALFDLEGVDEISSRSVEGGSTIFVEVETGYEPRILLDEVKSRVDAINTLPVEAERPIIELQVRTRDVVDVTIASSMLSEAEIKQLSEKIRDDLLKIDGISQIEINGVRNYEIAIELNPDQLRQHDLTLAQISNIINQNSLDLSAGNIKTQGGDILIRSKGQAYQQAEFENIVIKKHSDGSLLRLSDIAKVTDGFEESDVKTRINGKPGATIAVYRIGQQSAIEVAEKVKLYIEEQRIDMPEGVYIDYWNDTSQIVKKRISTLVTSALQGGILVLIMLSLFLRPAVAFWVFIGIPVSFLGAFFVMPFLGVSLNIVSLFGFIVVLGIVVDDAIVTGENIYKHLEKSDNGLQAAVQGTQEVAVPVTFGVLTTVAAFSPIFFMEGSRGSLFAQIPAVIVPVLLFSLIESKFVLPAHLKNLKVKNNEQDIGKLTQFQRKFAKGFESAILKYYQPALHFCLSYKGSSIIVFSGILGLILAASISGHTKFIFFPRVPSEFITATLNMPTGTPFEVTDKHVNRMTAIASQMQKEYIDETTGDNIILQILSQTGSGNNAAYGQVRFQITPPEDRLNPISSQTLLREWRTQIGDIPGAEELTFRAEIGRTSDPIDIQLQGNNSTLLNQLSEQIKLQLQTYPTVFDIRDSMQNGKDELQIELKPEAHILNLTRSDIVRQVRQAFFGVEAQRIQRGRDDVRVMVRFPKDARDSVASLNKLLINTPSGQQVPLVQLVDLKSGKSPSSIYRIDGYRTLNVRADLDKESTNMTVLNSDLKIFLDELIGKYPEVDYVLRGEAEEQSDSFTSLGIGVIAALVAIYVLLAIPLSSFSIPFIVMSVIPFGIIGAVIGHWIMGMSLSFMSLLGILALLGIVVNDSLVLVDYIGKMRAKGETVLNAVLAAGAARFRPVMLTSMTTFIGLMPLLFEKSTQAQFLIPMAVSLGFGIIFATMITLLFVPVNYMMAYQVKSWWKSL